MLNLQRLEDFEGPPTNVSSVTIAWSETTINFFRAPQKKKNTIASLHSFKCFPDDFALLCIREHSLCTCIKRVRSAPRRETCCACERRGPAVNSRALSSLLPGARRRLFIQHVAFSSRPSSGRPRSAAVSYPNLLQTWPLIVCVALLFLLMEFIIITKKAPVTHCWVDCINSSHASVISR